MKTIGLIGGMSWESTVTYYKLINEEIKKSLGGFHSAKIVLYSVDFDEIEACQSNGDWDKSAQILASAAKGLEKAGADFVLICANTMHKVAPQIQEQINIPIIHIADATADILIKDKIKSVGLLGTKYTMLQDFYKQKLISRGLDVIIPDNEDIETVNSVIYDELCLGIISEKSKTKFQLIIEKLKQKGAQAVILGCTEIGLLIDSDKSSLPVYDTTKIHSEKAAIEAIE